MAKRRPAALAAQSKQLDPVLGALFSSSVGPVSRPDASRYNKAKIEADKKGSRRAEVDNGDEEDDLSSVEEELDDEGDDDKDDEDQDEDDEDEDDAELGSEDEDQALTDESDIGNEDEQQVVGDSAMEVDEVQATEEASGSKRTTRKRKRRDDTDDLENRYLKQLAREEEAEEAAKKKQKKNEAGPTPNETEKLAEDSSSEAGGDDDDPTPLHESLETSSKANADIEKAKRTVFLSNVSVKAAASNSDKRTLVAHLASILDTSSEPAEKVESIRFRSLPISDTALPKRAAYITGSIMDSTTHSANAYVVYSTAAAARRAVSKLNGTQVLDRHLRVDSVAHPGPTDHHRCVFVGNLVYMDDETITTKNSKGETVTKKRSKKPADVEEGLWRMFGQEGRRVENVRVPRDPKTRVGKGFAYVQFYDQNDVESALLLNGKKYPPMLPRPLRVTRAKPPHRTALAMERTLAKRTGIASKQPRDGKYVPKISHEQRSLEGRAAKLFGRSAVTRPKFGKSFGKPNKRDGVADFKSPETVVAEGRRASAKDGLPAGMKLGRPQRAKGAGRKAALKSRGSKRAAEWRKSKAK